MAAEAAILADEAASIAEVAADEAAIDADDVSTTGGVTMVVVEVDGVVIVEAGGVVVVVVTSSFLLQAAKDRAAARLTIKIAVFMFLLGGFRVRKNFSEVRQSVCRRVPSSKDKKCASISDA